MPGSNNSLSIYMSIYIYILPSMMARRVSLNFINPFIYGYVIIRVLIYSTQDHDNNVGEDHYIAGNGLPPFSQQIQQQYSSSLFCVIIYIELVKASGFL
jgi:hypothetical protein